jgi:hypothetical protein
MSETPINRSITELNGLRPTAFTFAVQMLPSVSFFCQSASIPTMALGSAILPTPLVDIPTPGDKLTFGELTIKFQIQENFANYMELFSWMVTLGFPQDNAQFATKNIYARSRGDSRPAVRKSDIEDYSDATLTVYTADNNPVAEFRFADCFPIRLEGLDFSSTNESGEYMIGTATFVYRQFTPVILVP